MVQQALAVFFVLSLFLLTLWALKKRGAATFQLPGNPFGKKMGTAVRKLQVLERISLTPQHSLHLVSIQGKPLLLAISPAGCHPIDLTKTLTQNLLNESSLASSTAEEHPR